MATSENRITIEKSANNVDVGGLETQFKKIKSRTKANFTRSRNNLLFLLDEEDMPSGREVKEACKKMDSCMELVMDVLSKILDFYIKTQEFQRSTMEANEMVKIETDFYRTSEAAQEYLQSRKEDASSVASDILSIDLCQGMNITDDRSETFPKEATVQPRTSAEVKCASFYRNISASLPMTIGNEQPRRAPVSK